MADHDRTSATQRYQRDNTALRQENDLLTGAHRRMFEESTAALARALAAEWQLGQMRRGLVDVLDWMTKPEGCARLRRTQVLARVDAAVTGNGCVCGTGRTNSYRARGEERSHCSDCDRPILGVTGRAEPVSRHPVVAGGGLSTRVHSEQATPSGEAPSTKAVVGNETDSGNTTSPDGSAV